MNIFILRSINGGRVANGSDDTDHVLVGEANIVQSTRRHVESTIVSSVLCLIFVFIFL